MSSASIVEFLLIPNWLGIAECVCDEFIHGEYVSDAEYGAQPHLRAGWEEVWQSQVEGMNALHAVFQGIEAEEVNYHHEDSELADTIKYIEALDNLKIYYENDWEVEDLAVQPKVKIRSIRERGHALADETDQQEH